MKFITLLFSAVACLALSSCGSAPEISAPSVPIISVSEGLK